MSFSIQRVPLAFDLDRADEAVAPFGDLPQDVQDLIHGMAGCSPHLRELLRKEPDLIGLVTDLGPDAVLAGFWEELEGLEGDLKPGFRRIKHKTALLCALCDLSGVWPLERVTGTLTELADRTLDMGLKHLIAKEIERKKLPGMGPDDVHDAGGMCVLAMGKMGAHELNYSSDIDLICLFDETRFSPDTYMDARSSFVRVTRNLMALMSEVTADGYVFRTDLRLRPDASVTPVCIAMETAERYYESVGRTWERAAYIKARPCAGDIAAGSRFLQRMRPFVWRKHLDFAAIQDAHDMRLRIRSHKGLGHGFALEGHNLKLGAGGIREIEFFTQTRQLIAGGRDESLRLRGTVEALQALCAAGWVPQEASDHLIAAYRRHRETEHRLQMIGDAQTHSLPSGDFEQLARFSGWAETDAFREDLTARLTLVAGQTEDFFSPGAPAQDVSTKNYLERWRRFPALRSERAVQSFKRLFPPMLERLEEAEDPEGAIGVFEQFISGLPAGVQVFSLFEANPPLGALIVDICAMSPALAAYLGRNAQVLDAVIAGRFFETWPGRDELLVELRALLDKCDDYETKLDTARRWQKEWHFRIGVHHLRAIITAQAAGAQYAELAEVCVAALWPDVEAELARKHGRVPNGEAVVLGMGSVGTEVLTSRSDLDLIVIYDAHGADASDGRRPLAARTFYSKLTQALITALSAPTAEGRLYEVDMRLRPSGQAGPVATSLQAYEIYQKEEAWVWEHMALTRARVLAGPEALAKSVSEVRAKILARGRDEDTVRRETREMRVRLAQAQKGTSRWVVKAGAGGAQDIDLFCQGAALVCGSANPSLAAQIACAEELGWCSHSEGASIYTARTLYWNVSQALRLIDKDGKDPDQMSPAAQRLLLHDTGASSLAQLAKDLDTLRAQAAYAIDRAISEGVADDSSDEATDGARSP